MKRRSILSLFLVLAFLVVLLSGICAGQTETETEVKTEAATEAPAQTDTKEKAQPDAAAPMGMSSQSTGASGSQVVAGMEVKISDPTNTGGLNASIPIEVPSGRNGIAPNIPLNYNSNRGNGWVGMGWDIDTGSIQRSMKKGLDYGSNDYTAVMNGASSDLIVKGNNYYAAKIEKEFNRYFFNTSTGGWEVTAKNGTKYYYGSTAASRQDFGNGTKVFKWCLDKVIDTNGNYMTVTYTKNEGEIYPDRIDYTGNTSLLSPTKYVKFYFEDRTDTEMMFFHYPVKTAKRLKTIEVRANGAMVRAYGLTYVTSGGTSRSLLSSVQVFGNDTTLDAKGTITGGTALPPMILTYSVENKGTFQSEIAAGPYTTGTQYWGYQRMAADINGDGKSDLIYLSGTRIVAWLSQGDGTFSAPVITTTDDYSGDTKMAADINGDGKSDLIYLSGTRIVAWLSQGDGTFSAPVITTTDDYSLYLSSRLIADVNGDGKADLVNSNFRSFIVLLGRGDGTFSTPVVTTTEYWHMGLKEEAVDVNGDGNADMVLSIYSLYLAGPEIIVLLAQEEGLPFRLTTLVNPSGGVTSISYTPSSAYENTRMPFILPTVSSITQDDGNGNRSTTSYTYSGGLYDYRDREFRGFAYQKTTAPNGTTSETWYKQDNTFKGLPYKQVTKDVAGNTYRGTYNTYQYESPHTGVNFPYLSQKDDYFYDGASSYKQSRTSFAYDIYGSLTQRYLYGDVNVSGDERVEYTEYTIDQTKWMHLPATVYVKDTSGNTKAQQRFSYDTNGNLTEKQSWLQGDTNPSIRYGYNTYGNQISVTDPGGNTTTTSYDATYTYPVSTTNPLGHSTSVVYDTRYGLPLSKTDVNGNTTSYTYDVFGRLIRVTNPYDTQSTYGTVSYEYPDTQTGGLQRVFAYNTERSGTSDHLWTQTHYDGLGRVYKTRSEGPDNKVIVIDTVYNRYGQVEKTSLPYFEDIEAPRWIRYAYDPVGRVIQVTKPDNTIVSKAYMQGRTTTVDANGHQKVEERDVYGRLVKVEEYTGTDGSVSLYATTTYQYDTIGNLITVTDAAGNQATMTYDPLSRKTSMNDPDMGNWSYGYDSRGNLVSQTDAKGRIITFTYDALSRMTQKNYPTGKKITYTYDEASSTNVKGRLTTISDPSGTETYNYDKLGRVTQLTKMIDSIPYTTTTTYDALGRISTLAYPDNDTIAYTYDTGGNTTGITGYVTYSSFNAMGQPGSVAYANGATTQYQYRTDNNRLYSITTNSTKAGGLQNLSYTYDKAGNIAQIRDHVEEGRSHNFTYDHLNRLTQAQSTAYGTLSWQYNEIGNMTYNSQLGSYTYGTKPHAVVQAGTNTYAYDANGNMTQRMGIALTYDDDNRPITIGTTSFAYDAKGQRVKKTSSGVTTTYIDSHYECTGGTCKKYIFSGSTRIAVKMSNDTWYYHPDHLGSSHIVTDASGNKVEEIYYSPYGETRQDTGSVSVKHKFTGQEADDETGLYYYGARYYDPQLGRFISPDSIVQAPFDPQTLNRYSYCGNNPVVYIDPSGHSWLSDFFDDIGLGFVNDFFDTTVAAGIGYCFGGWPGAAIAAGSNLFLSHTGVGRELTQIVAKTVFEDMLGLSPQFAYMASSITLNAAMSWGLYKGYDYLNKTPTATIDYEHPIGKEGIYDPQYGEFIKAQNMGKGGPSTGGSNVLETVENGGTAYPVINEQGEIIGLMAKRNAFGLPGIGIEHTATIIKGSDGFYNSMSGFGGFNIYGVTSVCHQMTNQAIVQAGYALTVNGSMAGWASYLSGAAYGPYGSAEPGLSYFEAEKNRER